MATISGFRNVDNQWFQEAAFSARPLGEGEGAADLIRDQILVGTPTVLSCLAALASLKVPENGAYRWPLMEPRFSPEDLDRHLRSWHDEAFACWLSLTPMQQASELRQHLTSQTMRHPSIRSSFRSLIPAEATAPEIHLCELDLQLSLSLLEAEAPGEHSDFGAGAGRHALTLLRAIKVSGGAISLSLKELSAGAGVTPNHLGRIFHEQVGRSFREYLRLMRLGRAAYLLRRSRKPVKHLAAEAGYPDASNFVHDFKDTFGKSPLTYRADVTLSDSTFSGARSLILTIACPNGSHLDFNSDATVAGSKRRTDKQDL